MRRDARRLTCDQLTELRIRAVGAVQAGESPEAVARAMGVNRATVYGWLALYRAGGWGRLNARKRGGRKPKLDAKAIKWIYRTVTMNQPLQFKFPFALWTSKMLAVIIAKHLGVKLSKASVCRLLAQMGLTAQRPLWRAYQQNPAAVRKWLKEQFPAIRAQARQQKAEIWFGDEAGVRSDFHSGTTWAPKGQTPIVSSTGARFGMNIISAVSPKGQFRFMCVKGRVNASVFVAFLKRLIHDAKGKVFLIVDGHPAHKAAMVKRFLHSSAERIQLFFLPPYSPELNPDELVWNDLKNNCLGRKALTSREHLKSEVISFLRFLQKTPQRIRSYFQAPTTCYAS